MRTSQAERTANNQHSEGELRAFRVAYDGRPFHGFQRQPDVPTVEGALLRALCQLDIVEDPETVPPGYAAAGRTDAGVSALGQTVAFECPDWVTPAPINGALPETVRVWASAEVDADFHARFSADSRTYLYLLRRDGIDLELATEVCDRLEGTHDFHNLTAARGATVRTIDVAKLQPMGEFIQLWIRGDGFLHEQVRRIATVIETIASGERSLALMDRLLSSDPVDGPDGVGPSRAEYLLLYEVSYPATDFVVSDDARRDARNTFLEARRHHAIVSHVMGSIVQGIARDGNH